MRCKVIGTATILLAVAPAVSFALGLGEIQLRSSLNSPLNAEIELTATAEEMTGLRARLASRDTFTRYGLDYPAFLSGIQVRVERQAGGRNVIRLTSTAPMTEPFATLLVEANWSGGQLFHEYTVLFDPPAFAPVQTPAAPVASPVAGGGDRSAAIVRTAPPAAPAPVSPSPPSAPITAAAAAPAARSGEYSVRSGDSLSAIAQRQYGPDAERAMVAIYRGNEYAFDGNMNRLRAGALLRLPDNAAVSAIDAREAAAEVRRQAATWTRPGGAAATAGSADPRLRLVPPAATGSGNASGDAALRERVAALESEQAELKRQLESRIAELARLQAGASAGKAAAPAVPPVVSAPASAPAPAATPVAEAVPATTEAVPPAAVQATSTEAAPAPKPAVRKPVIKTASEKSGSSLLGLLQDYWYGPAALLALLLGAVGLKIARRRREAADDAMAPFAVAPVVGRDSSSDTLPLRKPLSEVEDPILVEESGTHEQLNIGRKEARTVDLDDTSASMSVPALDSAASLDQGDALAEADFHMAYGLYDQAADLVKLAIQREPARRDLKLKLLEVFFVWGNKDQFLQTARELADTRESAPAGEWEKVVIMGKQLAPDDALFSQSSGGSGSGSVDLNLEGGQNLVDFDLQGEPSMSVNNEAGVDLDLGAALQLNDAGDGAAALDFMLDDPARGGDMESTATTRAQPALADLLDDTEQRLAVEGPTVEQPTLVDSVDALASKLGAQAGFLGQDQTAELSIDDLGLDLGKFDVTGTNASLMDDSQLAHALDTSEAPTLVAGIDEISRKLNEELGEANHPTELLPLVDAGFESTGATSQVVALDMDFNLDANAETGRLSALDADDDRLDLDVGAAELPADGEYIRTQNIQPADSMSQDLEPVTMSEVGTKLDLARAYMDMGDPDGARSILREVLQEGTATQRQEAQRLIDSIPG